MLPHAVPVPAPCSPSRDVRGLAAGQVQGGVLGDGDGLLHGGQQTLAPLAPQGGPEALGPADQQLHHHVGVLLHALAWRDEGGGTRGHRDQGWTGAHSRSPEHTHRQ